MDVGGAAPAAGARRAVAGVAVVADELDRWCERAGGAGAGACACRGPAEVVSESAGGGVPARLCAPVGGDEVDCGAVAMGLVAGFARGGDTQVVAAQDPHDVVIEACVDWLWRGGAGEGPGRERAERARLCDVLCGAQVGWAACHVEAACRWQLLADGSCEVVVAQACVQAGAREYVGDIGLRVVVAEDRLAEVAVGVAQQSAQVVGGRGDGVAGVIDVRAAVAVAVDAIAREDVPIAVELWRRSPG